MKYFWMLLLVPYLGMAQWSKSPPRIYHFQEEEINKTDAIIADSMLTLWIGSRIVFLYDEYAKECWADSTLVKIAWGFDKGGYGDYWERPADETDVWIVKKYGDNATLSLKKRWEHHKKPTFQGFIDWLRKRTK